MYLYFNSQFFCFQYAEIIFLYIALAGLAKLIYFNSFFQIHEDVLYKQSWHLQIRWFYFFLFNVNVFYFCLILLAGPSSTPQNRTGESRHLSHIPQSQEESVQSFIIKYSINQHFTGVSTNRKKSPSVPSLLIALS